MKTRLSTNHGSPPSSTRSLLKGLWGHLSIRRRIQLGVLLVVMLGSGAAEMLSLSAAMPFLAVLSNPDLIWQNQVGQVVVSLLGIEEYNQLFLSASLLFATAAVLSALIRLTNLWLNGRLAAAVGSDLSCEAYVARFFSLTGCI